MSSSQRHRRSRRFRTLCAACQERKARFRFPGPGSRRSRPHAVLRVLPRRDQPREWSVSAESVVDFGARRLAGKARGPRIPRVCEGGATPPGRCPKGTTDSADTGQLGRGGSGSHRPRPSCGRPRRIRLQPRVGFPRRIAHRQRMLDHLQRESSTRQRGSPSQPRGPQRPTLAERRPGQRDPRMVRTLQGQRPAADHRSVIRRRLLTGLPATLRE